MVEARTALQGEWIEMLDLLAAQLIDPFRIGLLVMLLLTTRRTLAHTGRVVPLLLGAIFVAVLIPTALGQGAVPLWQAIMTGLAANIVILAVLLAAWALWLRFSAGRSG